MIRPGKAEDRATGGEDIRGDGGIIKALVIEGKGEIIPKDVRAIVHYTGKLQDGSVFDSSVRRGMPFEFNIGRREVILGWDLGVATMRKGESCVLTCKPDYAYGGREIAGLIPANSTLVFEVELLGWKNPGSWDTNDLLYPLIILFVIVSVGILAYNGI
jgi:FKBP-type peptidyl-prolyl cis-trans isomerase